jgi:DNA helicase-2/ATP-dependent DNA helicase PcrA
MKFIADLHIHSPYSRAVSPEMVFSGIDVWAKKKGITVMATGDFTHPRWFAEMEKHFIPAEPGLFTLKEGGTRFILSAELSSIYSRGGKVRRVHNLLFAPDLKTVRKINNELIRRGGNLLSDGRPIIGLDSEDLLLLAKEADERNVLIPAHAWTPWFSVFGSMSGFDSLEECFGDNAKHIFAIETGLSSDPEMNWRLSRLDNISFISNSDSHSLPNLGREANVFDAELSYAGIIEAIKSRDPGRFLRTIEFFPEEGKYHYDGHRLCGVSLNPKETKKLSKRCPACGREITVGVMSRVEELADRPEGYRDPKRVPFVKLILLQEIIAEALGVGKSSKKVKEEYERMISSLGPEIRLLSELPVENIRAVSGERIAEGISRVRQGKISIRPGYDGEYGKIAIFGEEKPIGPKALF